MIISGSTVKDGTSFEADVCVVGAGAAGLTLALELAGRGLKIVLVESGGLDFQPRSHDLLKIELAGQSTEALVNGTRERFFGGTTNHWGGTCRALDPFEFERHDWVANSGWPMSRADLQPYYILAAELLGLPEVDRRFDAEQLGVAGKPRLVSKSDKDIEPIVFRNVRGKQVRMGIWRREEVEKSELITCVLDTSIIEIRPDASKERISFLDGRAFGGNKLIFRARDYVLCTGAIENARLLLVSDSTVKGGLGNEHDVVGRYFMDHPSNLFGQFLITDPVGRPSQEESLSANELVGWTTTAAARKEYKLHGFVTRAWPRQPLPQMQIPHELAIDKLVQSSNSRHVDLSSFRYLSLFVNWEQAPNPNSRVMLSNKRDIFGVRKPLLHWSVLPQDLASVRKSTELFSLAVARSGLGRVRTGDATKPLTVGGGHQMGTTRMSNDPKTGVTDSTGRVHSLENLFIGGSSLFPTGGWQNPTFTIMALTLRLADHLSPRAEVA